MTYASVLRREATKARIAALPPALKAGLAEPLKAEIDALVEAMKRAAPEGSVHDTHPGQLRDSIHAYPNAKRELSFFIIANPRDEHGHIYSGNVEFGHLTPEGRHVPASPFFWPTWRAQRKGIKRRLAATGRRIVKRMFPAEASN